MGKSTTAVNLAYTLAQMGAKVGILDADVYGPSLPTMVKPDPPVLQMDPETKAIRPPEFEGVKVVSFGFAGQGSAIMRGPMVSGESQILLNAVIRINASLTNPQLPMQQHVSFVGDAEDLKTESLG